jgi:hypothetical protein
MSDEDILKVGYWIDKILKLVLGIFIAIAGFEYKVIKNTIDDLNEKKHVVLAEIQILKSFNPGIEKRLERIETKIDRLTGAR